MTEDPLNVNYARWATEEEFKKDLKEAPMKDCTVEKSGIPLFCSDTSAYVDTSDSHSLIIGSSGSKKTGFLFCQVFFVWQNSVNPWL